MMDSVVGEGEKEELKNRQPLPLNSSNLQTILKH